MRATAFASVARRGERSVLADVRCEPPLGVRRCGDRLLLVSTAAGPVGGDELALHVVVGADATARVGSVAAAMAWPAPDGTWSRSTVDVEVGPGGHLEWAPEPLVSVARSRHRAVTRVRLAAGGTCRLVDEVALGRHGERSGELVTSLRVERDGRALIHHDEHLGPHVAGAGSLVAVGDARHLVVAVEVGPAAGVARSRLCGSTRGAWLPIADDAAVVLVTAADRPAAVALAAQLRAEAAHDDADRAER